MSTITSGMIFITDHITSYLKATIKQQHLQNQYVLTEDCVQELFCFVLILFQ